jgi:hypothetical protein
MVTNGDWFRHSDNQLKSLLLQLGIQPSENENDQPIAYIGQQNNKITFQINIEQNAEAKSDM